MNRIWIAGALVALSLGFAAAAQANAIPIYNTGAGAATPGQADPHWTIVSTPASSAPATAYVVTAQPGTWGTNPNSQWIASTTSGNASVAPGNYGSMYLTKPI